MKWKHANANGEGIFRVYNHSHKQGVPPRVWIAEVVDEKTKQVIKSPILTADTVLQLRSAGNHFTDEAFASDLTFG